MRAGRVIAVTAVAFERVELPPDLVAALAGILADALVADLNQYPQLVDSVGDLVAAGASPPGHAGTGPGPALAEAA